MAHLAIFDETGRVPELIPIYRKNMRVGEFDVLVGTDQEKFTFTHKNPFTILGRNVKDVLYLCRSDTYECENPEDWYKENYILGNFVQLVIEWVARLTEIKKGSQEGFSSMKNLGILVLVALIGVGAAIGLNAFFFHFGYPRAPPAPPVNATATGIAQSILGMFL